MKIKYTCKEKKILDFEDVEDGFYIVLTSRNNDHKTVFRLNNPVFKDNKLYWDNNNRAWDKPDKRYIILNKEDGELYLKTHNLKVIN